MTFEKLLRLYRFYEALALYDAYYERAADLNDKYAPLGDALDIAWVPLVFHCTYFENLEGTFTKGELRPGKDRNNNQLNYVALTELPLPELTRFRTLRSKPFEIAIGFPRALLESKGLFQPAYLKHATQEVKDKFKDVPSGYVELNDDLGALHEVRVPGSLPMDDAVWVLSSKRNEQSGKFDIPELKPLDGYELAVSFWDPSHQQGMIQEPVFRCITRDAKGNLNSMKRCGKHYLQKMIPAMNLHVEKTIFPPAGNPFTLRFRTELRTDTLKDAWEGPFSKYEMATFCFEELKKTFPDRINEIKPRIAM